MMHCVLHATFIGLTFLFNARKQASKNTTELHKFIVHLNGFPFLMYAYAMNVGSDEWSLATQLKRTGHEQMWSDKIVRHPFEKKNNLFNTQRWLFPWSVTFKWSVCVLCSLIPYLFKHIANGYFDGYISIFCPNDWTNATHLVLLLAMCTTGYTLYSILDLRFFSLLLLTATACWSPSTHTLDNTHILYVCFHFILFYFILHSILVIIFACACTFFCRCHRHHCRHRK